MEFWANASLLFCVAAGAYLFGCVNGAIFTSTVFCHSDVRQKGSGNAGLTNFTGSTAATTRSSSSPATCSRRCWPF